MARKGKDESKRSVSSAEGSQHKLEERKQQIRDFHAKHGRLPNLGRGDGRPGYWLRCFCSPKNASYDFEFSAEMLALGYRRGDQEGKRERIREFVAKNGRLPSKHHPEEIPLHTVWKRLRSPHYPSFDAEFCREIEQLVPPSPLAPDGAALKAYWEERKQMIRDFYSEHKRLPSNRPSEKSLANSLRSICSPSHRAYDPNFVEEMRSLGRHKVDPEGRKAEVRAFVKRHGRLPSSVGVEKRLYVILAQYCSARNGDPKFCSWALSLGYRSKIRGRRPHQRQNSGEAA